MLMNLVIPAVQIYGGILSGSIALISNALLCGKQSSGSQA